MRGVLAGVRVWVALLCVPSPAGASDLPVTDQAVFLLRVLAYDRNLKMRTPEAVTILLAYQAGNDPSQAAKNELTGEINRLAKDRRVADLSIRVTPIAYTSLDDLDASLRRTKPPALVVCPGLDASLPVI